MSEKINFIDSAKDVIALEAAALTALAASLDHRFEEACLAIQKVLKRKGRLIVMGMGKSGHIGNKMAATFASTGTPSYFVHPAEASHGDLGMVTEDDAVLALSNSGESDEIAVLLPILKRQGVLLIAITGNEGSTLAKQADIHLHANIEKEACPLNLAPTTSTTTMLALGDALAVALLKANQFKQEDFARSHPGGKLGKRLLTYVKDIMRTGDALPISDETAGVLEALMTISKKGLGITIVQSSDGNILGVFTDGDLRRLLERYQDALQSLQNMCVADVMTNVPITIQEDILAAEALAIMQAKKISVMPVLDSRQNLSGVISMHDLLSAGIM